MDENEFLIEDYDRKSAIEKRSRNRKNYGDAFDEYMIARKKLLTKLRRADNVEEKLAEIVKVARPIATFALVECYHIDSWIHEQVKKFDALVEERIEEKPILEPKK